MMNVASNSESMICWKGPDFKIIIIDESCSCLGVAAAGHGINEIRSCSYNHHHLLVLVFYSSAFHLVGSFMLISCQGVPH